VAAFSAPAQNDAPKFTSWSGTIVYSSCNADEAFNESPECFRAAPGAKLALYDDTNRVMYSLEPQEKIAGHLGDTVTLRGTLEEDTIQVSAIELLSIGLAVGQKAPAFSARDQLGRVQSLDTLKGPNGTVLLFFRSADW
jgi:nitrogen fixation protein FixH